jgi:hypothetical protein
MIISRVSGRAALATEDKEHGAREVDGAAPEGETSGTHNLPALIDSAPTAPVPVERLAAQPEDAFERFAFTLWNAGRKEEAVELLERQIAKQKAEKAAAAAPPLWAISRPLIAVVALVAIAAGVVWTGYDRIAALPQWVASFQTLDEASDATELAAVSEMPAVRLPRPRGESASEPEVTSALAAPSADPDSLDDSAPPTEPVPLVENVAAVSASDKARAAVRRPAPIQSASPVETPESPVDAPPPETSVGVSDMVRATRIVPLAVVSPEPSSTDEGSALPEEEEVAMSETAADSDTDNVPVTLRSLAERAAARQSPADATFAPDLVEADLVETVGGPRLPRARPEPSPELVAALNAIPREVPERAATRDRGGVEPYVVRQPPRQRIEDAPGRRVIVVRPNGLTIVGRVRPLPPGLVMRREHAERYIARRRAAERAWADGDTWPPDAYDDDAYESQGRSVYRRQLPWVPRGYVVDGY